MKTCVHGNTSLLEQYFKYDRECVKTYGKNTVICMEVGSFFEIYAKTEEKIKEVTQIMNISLTRKNKKEEVSSSNPYMAGIPSCSFHMKYLQLLVNSNFVVVEISQTINQDTREITRSINAVHSPGMIQHDIVNVDISDRYLSVLWCEEYNYDGEAKSEQPYYYCGLSFIDINTGKIKVSESDIQSIQSLLMKYKPKELVIYSNKSIPEISQVCNIVHQRKTDETNANNISYQNKILSDYYKITSILTPIEHIGTEKYPCATTAFVIMLEYVSRHNFQLLKNLSTPDIIQNSEHLQLSHASSLQLQILSDGNTEHNMSIQTIINKTCTTGGKRLLYTRVMQPIYDVEELEKRYNYIDQMMKRRDTIDTLRSNLKYILDLSRLHRKFSLGSLTPFQLYNLVTSYTYVITIMKNMKVFSIFDNDSSLLEKTELFVNKTNNIFDVSKMQGINFNNIDKSFYKKGYNVDIDNFEEELVRINSNFNNILKELNNTLDIPDAFILKYNDKDGYYVQTTQKRWGLYTKKVVSCDYSVKKTASACKMFSKKLESLTLQKLSVNSKLISTCKKLFIKYLEGNVDDQLFSNIDNYVAIVDVIQSSSLVAIENKYCRPILETSSKSYLYLKDVRHPIIEKLISTRYVSNDVSLNYEKTDDKIGMIIFGVNASGKSSLMKSVALAVIMAQSGLYVAANSFVLSPYKKIFTRIGNNDDIFSGHSTFVNEIIDLKNILQNADNQSLVLADELASGTEYNSSLTIVATTLSMLHDLDISFITASHLHELVKLDEIIARKKIIHYNIATDIKDKKIFYRRKLERGIGNTLYGLMVARFLINNDKFISIADKIQEKQYSTKYKNSKYNSEKIVGVCELCKKRKTDETHHIVFQSQSDKDGYIDYRHKNHKSNLIGLCIDCHNKVHTNKIVINGYVQTNQGLSVDYQINT